MLSISKSTSSDTLRSKIPVESLVESVGTIQSLCIVEKDVWSASGTNICVWDSITHRLKKEIKAHKGMICNMLKVSDSSESSNSSNNKVTVWSASWDCTVKQWSAAEHMDFCCLRVLVQDDLPKPQPFTCLALVDGLIWSGTLRHIYVWSFDGKKKVRFDLEDESTNSAPPITIATDQKNSVFCAINKQIWVFSLMILRGIMSNELLENNDTDINNNEQLTNMENTSTQTQTQSKILNSNVLTVPLKPTRILLGHKERVNCFEIVKESLWSGDNSGDLIVWSTESLDMLTRIKAAHQGPVYCIMLRTMQLNLHPTRRKEKAYEVWTSGKDSTIRIWDSETYMNINLLHQLNNQTDNIVSMINTSDDKIWTGSHSLCIWSDSKKPSKKFHLISFDDNSKYVGEVWNDDPQASLLSSSAVVIPHGRGEIHYTNGDVYVGHWVKGKKNGFGILTSYAHSGENTDSNPNIKNNPCGFKYYGNWLNDHFQGFGLMVSFDGSMFVGTWRNSKRRGIGTLFLPNGDKMEGEWNDEEILKAKYIRGNPKHVALCLQSLFAAASSELGELKTRLDDRERDQRKSIRFSISPTQFGDGNHSPFEISDVLEDVNVISVRSLKQILLPFSKWSFISPTQLKQLEKSVKEGKFNKISIPTLSLMLNDKNDVLGGAVDDFSYMFDASYHPSYGRVLAQLPNAIDDVHTFIVSMSQTMRAIFPNLNEKDTLNLVHSTVFSRVYNSVFGLFNEMYKNRDSLFSVKMNALRSVTLKDLGVSKKFWLSEQQETDNNYDHETIENQKEEENHSKRKSTTFHAQTVPYQNVISVLLRLAEKKTIPKKLRCLVDASNAIGTAVENFYFSKTHANNTNNNRNSKSYVKASSNDRFGEFRVDSPERPPTPGYQGSYETLNLPLPTTNQLATSPIPLTTSASTPTSPTFGMQIPNSQTPTPISPILSVPSTSPTQITTQTKSAHHAPHLTGHSLSSVELRHTNDLNSSENLNSETVNNNNNNKTSAHNSLNINISRPNSPQVQFNLSESVPISLNKFQNDLNSNNNNNFETSPTNSQPGSGKEIPRDPLASLAMGAEDKFPILVYCLLKSGIAHLHSELALIKEFATRELVKDEEMYRLVELHQAICYIETLDWNVLDSEGVLVSMSSLEQKVMSVIKQYKTKFKQKQESCRVIWLAEILLMLGNDENLKQTVHSLTSSSFPLVRSSSHALTLLGTHVGLITSDVRYYQMLCNVLELLSCKLIKEESTDPSERPSYTVDFISNFRYPNYVFVAIAMLIERETREF